MLIKIDTSSEEFLAEQEKTREFTTEVCTKHGFVLNPDNSVNDSTIMGLTRNQMIYDIKFCPCFMVVGETKEDQLAADNRMCPCTPALTKEIPNTGKCHCGLFCTPEFARDNAIEEEAEIAIHEHSRGLTKEECEIILQRDQIDGESIEALLEARDIGFVDFILVDVREWMEWTNRRIKGTDFLVPTTSFYKSLEQIEDQKEKAIILYCHSGSRSAYCQNVMRNMGFKQVANYDYGIMTYRGEMLSGEE